MGGIHFINIEWERWSQWNESNAFKGYLQLCGTTTASSIGKNRHSSEQMLKSFSIQK